MKTLHRWFAGLGFSLVALIEIIRLWWDDSGGPPSGGALA